MLRQKITPMSFVRVVRLIHRSIRRPSDVPLAIKIGYFVLIVPSKLAKADLPRFLRGVGESKRPSADDVKTAVERIIRLRSLWLWLPMLSSRNTCYVRALTMYRFLDSEKSDVRIHFGVEPGINPNDRMKGHAWVTVDGRIIEPPEPVLSGRVKTIYSHPPVA
jgi:hypothetical protein